jgi:hypothetical protein
MAGFFGAAIRRSFLSGPQGVTPQKMGLRSRIKVFGLGASWPEASGANLLEMKTLRGIKNFDAVSARVCIDEYGRPDDNYTYVNPAEVR